MIKTKMAIVLGGLLLTSCASQLHRGVVAMKVDETTAHVGLNKNEVSAGDHVELFSNQCTQIKEIKRCKKMPEGHGIVAEVISDNYVSVKFDNGVKFK